MSDRGNRDDPHRELFVAFLERFAKGDVDREQWQHLIVNHYVDDTLERIRRDCVRMRTRNEGMRWSTKERDRIEAWIDALRTVAG